MKRIPVILFTLLFSITACAGSDGEKITATVTPTVDTRPVHPLQAPGADLSHLRLTPHQSGWRYSPSMVPNPDAARSSSSSNPIVGSEGVANWTMGMLSMLGNQRLPDRDYSQQEENLRRLTAENQRLAQENIQRAARLEQLRQERRSREETANQNTPPSAPEFSLQDIIQDQINRTTQEKVRRTLEGLDSLPQGFAVQSLRSEISGWDSYANSKIKILDLASRYVQAANRLDQNRTQIDQSFYEFSKVSFNAGFESLGEGSKIINGNQSGDFKEELQSSETLLKVGNEIVDFALGITPGISIGKDAYEAITGTSIVSGAELDFSSRAFAVLGVATGGGSNIVKGSIHALVKLGKTARLVRFPVGRGLGKVFKSIDSAGRHGIKIVAGPTATKVDKVILETLEGKGNLTSKFKLTADEALDAGKKWVGDGYIERKAGSGVFVSADGKRQFRIDNNSVLGNHAPDVPHVHLETLTPGQKVPLANNHIPFQD